MSDEITFTLHSPLTEEEWDMIADVDLDHTPKIIFHTKHGKEVVFVKYKTGKWTHGREIAREMIGDCTTAIFYDGWTCSECGCLVEKEREPRYKYCPNCGAKMEGSE